MDKLLNNIIDKNKKYTEFGRVATYIPELKKANGNDLGICIIDKEKAIVLLFCNYRASHSEYGEILRKIED